MNEPLLQPGDQKSFGPHGAGRLSSKGVTIGLVLLMLVVGLLGALAIYVGFLVEGFVVTSVAACVVLLVLRRPFQTWQMTRRMKRRQRNRE